VAETTIKAGFDFWAAEFNTAARVVSSNCRCSRYIVRRHTRNNFCVLYLGPFIDFIFSYNLFRKIIGKNLNFLLL
jgi:hypothetical protein